MTSVAPLHAATLLESSLRHDRAATLVLLVLLPLVCWLWIVVMARDMYGPMTGASAWMMTATWDLPHLLLLWAMWVVMMAGMMLPSAAPTLLLYAMMARSAGDAAAGRIYALATGYLAVWSLFSVAATVLQRGLASLLILSPMMEVTRPAAGATLLVLAGVYQLMPLKHACLRTCQSPFGFLMSRWRAGRSGAFKMGMEHGAYCVGCCWALMLVLFAGGVMNLMVIAALTVFVAFEKLSSFGVRATRVSGVLLVAAGLAMLAR